MKLDKLIYDVREALKKYSDDSELSDRYIVHLYNIKRAKYLRQDLNNYQRTSDNSIKQTFCLDLELVGNNECGVSIECDKLLRTTQPIPTPIELHTKVALNSVKPTNRTSVPFNFLSKRRTAYLDGASFQRAIYSFLDEDGYIYVTAGSGDAFKLLNCLTITGVFEDPLELRNYQNCCGCSTPSPCFDDATTDYPIQPHYIDLIKKEIVVELAQLDRIQEDKENDSND